MRQTKVVLIDDIDGSPADLTISFSFKKKEYEIDLTAEHAEEMKSDFDKWISKARRVDGRRPAPRRRAASNGPDANAVREWARSQGIEVSERGRVAARIVDAYLAAH